MSTATNNTTVIVYERDTLERLHYIRTDRRIFRRQLDSDERSKAQEAYHSLMLEAASQKERGKEEVKWLAEAIPAIDAQSIVAKVNEIDTRKNLCAAEAKLAEARAEVEIMAAALGFRWEEVDVRSYADDIAREVITVRADTLVQINKRRMSKAEEEAAEQRLQVEMFDSHAQH